MKNHKSIMKITLCAVMAALAIALNFLKIDIVIARLTFYALPLMFIGIVYGIGYGFFTGLVTGLVIQLTSPYGIGITSPVWALAPICWGFFSAVFNTVFSKSSRVLRITLVVVITSIIAFIANTLGSIADYYAYGYLDLNLVARLLALPITIPVYSVLLYVLDKRKELFVNNSEARDDSCDNNKKDV